MPVDKLKDYLDENSIKYTSIIHSPAFTTQEVAESAHISGKQVAKTVMIKKQGELAMVVLPANMHVHFIALQQELGDDSIELATEEEFQKRFQDCELGMMPPFGNLYGMDVYVVKELSKDQQIAFNAGTYSELIQMSFSDFSKMVNPTMIDMK